MPSAYPNPSVDRALLDAYRDAGEGVPSLSSALDAALRANLRRAGRDVPPRPAPTRTAAANAARQKKDRATAK